MRRGRDGYWHGEIAVPASSVGLRYRYSVDGGEPVPDPFSRWQPDGVHGDSWAGTAPADPPRPLTRTPELADAVIYELHIGTFTPQGTFAAAAAQLDYLVELGVTHVEVMPVATFPGRHGWGYDGVFPFAPHPAYGTPQQLRAFVAACHARGLAAILDVVYNHLGPDGNYLPGFGPCFAQKNRTLWGETMNFDEEGSAGIRRLVLDNATMWLREFGFDGLRLDAVHAIHDSSPVHILRELADEVRRLERTLHRRLVLIAESDLNDPKLVRSPDAGGYGLDAFWADDFHHAVHRLLTGESKTYYGDYAGLADVARALREGYIYQGQYAPSRQRRHGLPPGDLPRHQFVYCLQNHDQVGNRARGERLGHLVSPTHAKSAAALLLLAPGVPLLFQGEEWGATTPFLYFTDHQDPALGRAVSEGRRREFSHADGEVPDPQAPDTFAASKLKWEELAKPEHRTLFEWYRALIALRRTIPAGTPAEVRHDDGAGWLTLQRGRLYAAFNFADRPQAVPAPPGEWRLEFAAGAETGDIPPGGARIFRAA